MTIHAVIDAQFDRAVEIVQGLPKTGPVQTDYEEKLTMYSLYKQATIGNVKPPRPGIWDMLGRAKWDAWAKHRDLDPYEAKWLYVDALVKVLRKYSDKTVAKNLIEELESYGSDDAQTFRNQPLSHSRSDTSSSSSSEDEPTRYRYATAATRNTPREAIEAPPDETRELPIAMQPEHTVLPFNRPPSSISSRRYRTPLDGSLAMSPPPEQNLPAIQPHPGFETPATFAGEDSLGSLPSQTVSSYVGISPDFSHTKIPTSLHLRTVHSAYRTPLPQQPSTLPVRPVSRSNLERAVENVQVNLIALTERLESLETFASISKPNLRGELGPSGCGKRSPHPRRPLDLDELGMWSLVLRPLYQGLEKLRNLVYFFARSENHSPMLIVIRRLCLDASFLACLLICVKLLWKKSGIRRREIRAALVILWSAILGSKPQKAMVSGRL